MTCAYTAADSRMLRVFYARFSVSLSVHTSN